MKQYIDKSALVAEIENRIKELQNLHKENEEKLDSIQKTAILLCIDECKVILSLLDTLEVKEVEEETISEDLEYAALLHYPKMSRISEPHGFIPADNKSHYLGDANEDNRKAFIVGAQWQKERDQSIIELTEDHAYFAGSENTREKLIDKACEWMKDNASNYIIEHPFSLAVYFEENKMIEDFRKAMEE